ncbi:2-succinyl-5-enolpyruvyl-6-hydroxy-3-cyclohexene-1-carboxylic-acid synthase [Weeksella virosa]|uniref:2-succinyl-5-enolpyruvyl-6-hydroxy-3- cyclohexene-1-carboxylic-acid synthase n=1 Tax=Weeksella virosa TaxID=1014 RepID=UPI00255620AF|nr:2-succinyl-5-enolpyruvyl-6-hydroxy-3-cyclohexene-1-carboxylic-acid synthase [Weeksella virosa]MDK7675165.1 2-succinyl-5-enolpyruvyl-6-hydroxy-3-cyclohexene-1-carboxylic-acid synthase [Weeksella virosa]
MKKKSNLLNVQLVAETFLAANIQHIVLSPGSRNGALTMQFANDDRFITHSIIDERSAAFVALGIAQKLRQPVVICCTSGSAAANYYPAVTEAFYQNIPLIILTADRPEHLVDNFDGQTIRQKNLYQSHSYYSTQLSEKDDTETLTENMLKVKDALTKSKQCMGPVHINMPFSEPFYGSTVEQLITIETLLIPEKEFPEIDIFALSRKWNIAQKKLVLVGLHPTDKHFNQLINYLANDPSVVVLTEVTSNIHNNLFINKIDQIIYNLSSDELENLKPEILLTIGQNVVSKKIKNFIRNHPPKEHWHLDEFWQPDTFQVLNEKILFNKNQFLEDFLPYINPKGSNYYHLWDRIRKEKESKHETYIEKAPYSDLKIFDKIIKTFPNNSNVHYGNSSVIRYALLFDNPKSCSYFCNRGTSGIDGSTSTAVGCATVSKDLTILVTGDISFLYDSNALWNKNLPKNLRIILINNGGGNIFRFIPGPNETDVVEEFFETKHHLKTYGLAETFGLDYWQLDNENEIDNILDIFYNQDTGRAKILEIDTMRIKNATILKDYFSYLA